MQRLQDDELSDDPFLDDFKLLRRRVFTWKGARIYLPFVVRSISAACAGISTSLPSIKGTVDDRRLQSGI